MVLKRKVYAVCLLFASLPISGELYLDAARAALRRGRGREAGRFLARSPLRDSLPGLVLRARIRSGLGDTKGALAAVTAALFLDPGHPGALGIAVRLRLRLGHNGPALSALLSLLAVAPDARYTHSLAGRVYYRIRRYRLAYRHCRRALALKTDGWECFRMARICERLGRYGEALAWYSRAARFGVRPRSGWIRIMAGCRWRGAMALKRLGRLESAGAWFRAIRAGYPRTPYAKAAGEQLAALSRLVRWEQNRRKRKRR